MEKARPFEWRKPTLYDGAFSDPIIGDGIIIVPFLDEATCEWLVRYGDHLGDYWQSAYGDPVPGDELRLHRMDIGFAEWMAAQLNEKLAPIVNEHWKPATWRPVSDTFLIRYSADKQSDIGLHNDASHFSCSIVLERAVEGGVLEFPRQDCEDTKVPIGGLVCWPSSITHPHRVTPVTDGRRMSCVVWTLQPGTA